MAEDGEYITIASVRRTVGITDTSVINDDDVSAIISECEPQVERFFNTKFTPTERIEILDGNGTTSEKSSYTYEDTIEEPVSGDVYYYWLESIDYGGIVHHYNKAAQLTIPDLVDPGIGQIARPEIFGLLQNAPNPFVNGTRIAFNLHQTAQVELKIYNVKGELVKDLYSGISDYKSLQWNGTDDTGKQLSPGIYFYNLTVNGKSQEIKKLILMR